MQESNSPICLCHPGNGTRRLQAPTKLQVRVEEMNEAVLSAVVEESTALTDRRISKQVIQLTERVLRSSRSEGGCSNGRKRTSPVALDASHRGYRNRRRRAYFSCQNPQTRSSVPSTSTGRSRTFSPCLGSLRWSSRTDWRSGFRLATTIYDPGPSRSEAGDPGEDNFYASEGWLTTVSCSHMVRQTVYGNRCTPARFRPKWRRARHRATDAGGHVSMAE